MKNNLLYIILILNVFFLQKNNAQSTFDFDGQVSIITSVKLNQQRNWLFGGQYIPRFSYEYKLDTLETIDLELSAIGQYTGLIEQQGGYSQDAVLAPYRMWARYKRANMEVRVGLQKIDFGSAAILRPLQWFNQIDPRDPLGLTNGVYSILGRYYFKNNANIWLWGLYGNEKKRGFDITETYSKHPELGGRFQWPVPKGEMAISYHHRTALNPYSQMVSKIPEDRIGFDAKWDLKCGLWFESSFVRKHQNIGIITNQLMVNTGLDYTFGLGNGLNVALEHLMLSLDEQAFGFQNPAHITATSISYPIGFFDNLSAISYYTYASQDFSFFINYQHQFSHVVGYVMAYYIPDTQQGIQDNPLLNLNSGPGIRMMIVYNH